MHPFTQQSLGKFRMPLFRGHEIAERSEHGVAEALSLRQQRGGGRSQAHAISLELFKRVPSGAELGKRFLCLAAFRPDARLVLPALGNGMPGLLRLLRRAAGLVRLDAGSLDEVITLALGHDQLRPA
jgi:hypothetical protein